MEVRAAGLRGCLEEGYSRWRDQQMQRPQGRTGCGEKLGGWCDWSKVSMGTEKVEIMSGLASWEPRRLEVQIFS